MARVSKKSGKSAPVIDLFAFATGSLEVEERPSPLKILKSSNAEPPAPNSSKFVWNRELTSSFVADLRNFLSPRGINARIDWPGFRENCSASAAYSKLPVRSLRTKYYRLRRENVGFSMVTSGDAPDDLNSSNKRSRTSGTVVSPSKRQRDASAKGQIAPTAKRQRITPAKRSEETGNVKSSKRRKVGDCGYIDESPDKQVANTECTSVIEFSEETGTSKLSKMEYDSVKSPSSGSVRVKPASNRAVRVESANAGFVSFESTSEEPACGESASEEPACGESVSDEPSSAASVGMVCVSVVSGSGESSDSESFSWERISQGSVSREHVINTEPGNGEPAKIKLTNHASRNDEPANIEPANVFRNEKHAKIEPVNHASINQAHVNIESGNNEPRNMMPTNIEPVHSESFSEESVTDKSICVEPDITQRDPKQPSVVNPAVCKSSLKEHHQLEVSTDSDTSPDRSRCETGKSDLIPSRFDHSTRDEHHVVEHSNHGPCDSTNLKQHNKAPGDDIRNMNLPSDISTSKVVSCVEDKSSSIIIEECLHDIISQIDGARQRKHRSPDRIIHNDEEFPNGVLSAKSEQISDARLASGKESTSSLSNASNINLSSSLPQSSSITKLSAINRPSDHNTVSSFKQSSGLKQSFGMEPLPNPKAVVSDYKHPSVLDLSGVNRLSSTDSSDILDGAPGQRVSWTKELINEFAHACREHLSKRDKMDWAEFMRKPSSISGASEPSNGGFLPVALHGISKNVLKKQLHSLRSLYTHDLSLFRGSLPGKPRRKLWTPEEVEVLCQLRDECPTAPWSVMSEKFGAKFPNFTRNARALSDKYSKLRGKRRTAEKGPQAVKVENPPSVPTSITVRHPERPWTVEEGFFLARLRSQHLTDSWSALARMFNARFPHVPDRTAENVERKFAELSGSCRPKSEGATRRNSDTSDLPASSSMSRLMPNDIDHPKVSDRYQSQSSNSCLSQSSNSCLPPPTTLHRPDSTSVCHPTTNGTSQPRRMNESGAVKKEITSNPNDSKQPSRFWTAEETTVLKRVRESNPTDSWPEIAEKFNVAFPGSNRSARSIRHRYSYSESGSKLSDWTDEETSTLLRIRDANPSVKWSETLVKFVEKCPQSDHRTLLSAQSRFYKIKKDNLEANSISVEGLSGNDGMKSSARPTQISTEVDSVSESVSGSRSWSPEEDSVVSRLRVSNPSLSWTEITQKFRSELPRSSRSSSAIRNRYLLLNPSDKKNCCWRIEEIAILKRIRESHPEDSWSEIAQKFNAELPGASRSVSSIQKRYNDPTTPSRRGWTNAETSALLQIRDTNPNEKWSETLAKFVEKCPQSDHRTTHSVQCRFYKIKKEISEEKTQSVKGLAGKASMGSELSTDVHETSSELNSSVYEPGSERSSSAHEAGPESILSPKREGRPIIRRWAADQVSKESSYVPETGSGTSSDTHETGTCSESTGRMKNEGRHIHHWTDDQDSAISRLRESNPSLSWMEITQKFRSEFPLSIRSSSSIRNRHRKLYPSVRQKSYVIWSAEEIAVLKRIRESNPTDSWPEIAEKFHVEFPSSNRSIRSIRRRYNHPESSSKLTNYNWTEEETSALLRIRDANPSLKWSETLAKFVEECPQSHHRTMHSVQCQFSKIKKESSEEKTQSVKELPWKAGLVSEPSSGDHETSSGTSSGVHEIGSGASSYVH
eukprot:60046_1